MKPVLIEAVKELLRVALLAAIPVLADGLVAGEVDWRLVVISGIVAFLRASDKLLHEWGKQEDNKIMMKGLTGF